jgi:hypothetical protein
MLEDDDIFFGNASRDDFSREVNLLLNVNCRLIRNYQTTIEFHAICKRPQMNVSATEIVFSPGKNFNIFSEKAHDDAKGLDASKRIFLDLSEQRHKIEIANLFYQKLSYAIRNDSYFFQVFRADGHAETPLLAEEMLLIDKRGMKHELIVQPNIKRLEENIEVILKEKYIEEHFWIFNRKQLSEHYLISLRLTTGKLKLFYLAPGPKKAYPFNKLEETIIQFISDFERNFSILSTKLPIHEYCSSLESLYEFSSYKKLWFDYYCTVSELIFYGLKGSVGHFAFQLADLLFR